ncbi:MAG: type II toxin-antitoxin system Phd/YefM family antitoxin [Pseudomonadota bacterium]
MKPGESFSISTSAARTQLSRIVTQVQDPRAVAILTRHGRPVAAVVSMAEVARIWRAQDIEDIVSNGRRPITWTYGKGGVASGVTPHEAAERILEVQMDRRMEREVLKYAGLEPIPGGEVAEQAAVPARRWWQVWKR